MIKQFFTSLLCTIGLAGCGAQNQARPAANNPAPSAEATVVKTITVSGFDPDGEPEIKEMSDGALMLVFNFMPPSFAEDDEGGSPNRDDRKIDDRKIVDNSGR
ncbi:MAG TPA: hypothetical protein VF306_16905 [Pirellulales bacterium]